MAGGRGTAGRVSVRSARPPNFLVAGVQKSGTSFLCSILARHPSVFHTTPKEPMFFQRDDITTEGFASYLQAFYGTAGDQPRVGEGSTIYFQWPQALGNIRRWLGPDIDVIVSLRHPTDHAVSFYLHNLRKGRLRGDERIVDVGSDVRLSPVLTSLYASHIERWLDAYGVRLKFVLFDDLLESATAFVEQATRFLGIASLGSIADKAVNRGYPLAWEDNVLTLVGETSGLARTPRFTKAELEDLHARFLVDINRCERLLGRALTPWKTLPDFTRRETRW